MIQDCGLFFGAELILAPRTHARRYLLTRIALAQINSTVGDLDGNAELIRTSLAEAREAGAAITVLPELAITGYPPEDLLLRRRFVDKARRYLDEIAATVREGVAIVGFPEWDGDLFNAAAIVSDGAVQRIYRKRFLPNYGVFDEMRYFAAGAGPLVVESMGIRIGLCICEDIWYPSPISGEMAAAGIDLLVCPAASPFQIAKGERRERMIATRARDIQCAVAFCNLVGGQDELVFDGRSTVVDAEGNLAARAVEFGPELVMADINTVLSRRRRATEPRGRRLEDDVLVMSLPAVDLPVNGGRAVQARIQPPLGEEAAMWGAITRGIADYVNKNGLGSVVLGLSGGIDSALTAALAVDALGADRVSAIAMPSDFSSPESLADAQTLAESLAFDLHVLPISGPVEAFEDGLAELFAGHPRDVTEENLQARVRGTLLMAFSNKFGALVLATGNKSENAVGYATLYGDMVGGLSPIKDLSKTWVYRLARWHNTSEGREIIPVATIERPPTAELRPDQLDTHSLPPYEQLDPILEAYIERGLPVDAIVDETGVPRATVAEVVSMVNRAEYKRRQGAIGIKLSPRAFGRDRARGELGPSHVLVLAWFAVPLVLLSTRDVKFPRYLFYVLPPMTLFMALGVVRMSRWRLLLPIRRAVVVVALVTIVLAPRLTGGDMFGEREGGFALRYVAHARETSFADKPDNWQRIGAQVEFLQRHARPEDVVVTSLDDGSLGYYLGRFVYGFLNSAHDDAFFVDLLTDASDRGVQLWFIDTLPMHNYCHTPGNRPVNIDCRVKYRRFYEACRPSSPTFDETCRRLRFP